MNRTNRFRSVALASLLCTVAFSPSFAKTIYVDDDAPPPGDGTSWATAYTYLQDALADAESADKPLEIRVAGGTYKPDLGADQTPGDVEATFRVRTGMNVQGGFAGLDQPDPNARDVDAHETIFSGDLAGDDLPVVRAGDLSRNPNYLDNSFRVMTIDDPNGTTLIDGVTIVRGFDENFYFVPSGGAAIFCPHDSKPTIRNCTFKLNAAVGNFGGAIFGGAPNLINCRFERNLAAFGGAVADCSGSIRNCRFIANAAWWNGGALYDYAAPVQRSLFVGNSADEGGAVFLKGQGRLALSNCTLTQNRALQGGAVSCSSYGQDSPVVVSLTNCILWNGGDEIRSINTSTVDISYSDIQAGQAGVHDPCENVSWGQGNIDADPLFADPGRWDPNGTPDDPNDDFFVEGDYHLKSQAGRWDPSSESWIFDDVTSPCIDAGDPNSDYSAEVWPHGERINMGAYGGTPEASLSAQPTDLFLPRIACVYWERSTLAESCQTFLQAHACSVTLIHAEHILENALADYDLIMIATDTPSPAVWSDDQTVAALTESGKPVISLGNGGYRFFGRLGLTIGDSNGAKMPSSDFYVVDPDSPLYTGPYSVAVPEDRVLKVYDGDRDCVVLYLWPAPPESVTALGRKADDPGYYPLAAEQGHLLWGFTDAPDQMTEAGRNLFLNAVILTANAKLESQTTPSL